MKKLFKNSILKFQLIILSLILFSANYILAQNKLIKITGSKIEKKADKCIFEIYEQHYLDVVYNKNNTLMIYESDFVTKTDDINLDSFIKFNLRQKVDSLVYKIIAPFYKNYKSKYSDKTSEFDIFLHSKTDGKVCELAFSYNRDANIPLKAIEKLEGEILVLGLSLEFDPDSYYAKDALWVYYPVKYSVFRMKEKLKAGNK